MRISSYDCWVQFLPGAFRQMTWRMAPFFSGISPEMASRMNFSRTTETESRDDDHHEVSGILLLSTIFLLTRSRAYCAPVVIYIVASACF